MSKSSKDTETMPVRAPSELGRRRRWLTRVFPHDAGARWRIALQESKLVLGRDFGSPPLDDPQMSRRHVEISYASELDLHRVRDLGSKNGAHVDGRRIETEYLRAGSILRIGGSLFAYSEAPALEGVEGAREFAERMIDLVAPSATAVLIRGPSGAGKELLARRLHRASGRPGDFVAVNCATLSRDLVASELFGHKKGAFSGAGEDRPGLFKTADRGTLFLDEIADLPLDQQPALLRALQEKHIRPVGADREVPVDARIVAATHRDLAELAEQGKFRPDLLGRLQGARIELPGLDRRREEILPLLESFLAPAPLSLTADDAEALLVYDWPMNVRELEQAATHLKLAGVLPEEIQRSFSKRSGLTEANAGKQAPARDELIILLEKHRGNVASLAAELGRHRQQIYRWLSAHALDPEKYR